jgi:hypothetical protein
MKKVIVVILILTLIGAVSGCKKNGDADLPVRISFFDIRPQNIDDDETATITVSVSNLGTETALVKTIVDQGIANPTVTYTTGNPVYIEYIPPSLAKDQTTEAVITVVITDLDGKELDRVDGRIFIHD